MRRATALATAISGLLVVATPPSARATQDKAAQDRYAITDQEKAACTADAMRLCFTAYPNEERLLSCMKRNRASLTPTCLVVFDAGVKRRHL